MRLAIPESVQRRPWLGFAGSLALHLLLVASLVWVHAPSSRLDVKRGEPLFVELPKADEAAMRGLPGPPAPPTPEPPAPPAVKPTSPPPPAPKPVRPAVKRPPAVAKTPRPQPPAPPVVAKAPAPTPEPPKAEEPAPEPAPAKPAPPVPAPAPAAVAEPRPADTPPRPADTPPPPAVAAAPPRVASTTGPRASAAPDPLSALRRHGQGGAGGSGVGRAGIEGEPIPLDSRDPKYTDYLDQVRRRIKEKWAYPCVYDPGSGRCDYKNAQLVVQFGIRKDGPVVFVDVLKRSDFDVYDEYAVNAIKLASPFPPVPDSMTKGHEAGVPIVATFSYLVESSLTNLLR